MLTRPVPGVLFSVGSGGFAAPSGLGFILSVATVSFLFGYSCVNTFIFYTETTQVCDEKQHGGGSGLTWGSRFFLCTMDPLTK